MITINALAAADSVVIPTQPHYLSAKGLELLDTRFSCSVRTVESSNKRIADLDRLFSRIYEDNIIGKLSDERYTRMASEYENEQNRLISIV